MVLKERIPPWLILAVVLTLSLAGVSFSSSRILLSRNQYSHFAVLHSIGFISIIQYARLFAMLFSGELPNSRLGPISFIGLFVTDIFQRSVRRGIHSKFGPVIGLNDILSTYALVAALNERWRSLRLKQSRIAESEKASLTPTTRGSRTLDRTIRILSFGFMIWSVCRFCLFEYRLLPAGWSMLWEFRQRDLICRYNSTPDILTFWMRDNILSDFILTSILIITDIFHLFQCVRDGSFNLLSDSGYALVGHVSLILRYIIWFILFGVVGSGCVASFIPTDSAYLQAAQVLVACWLLNAVIAWKWSGVDSSPIESAFNPPESTPPATNSAVSIQSIA